MESFENIVEEPDQPPFIYDWLSFLEIVRPSHKICFEDLCNILATCGYSYLDEYIDRIADGWKDHQNSPVSPILKNTMGLLVYQEQILEILHEVVGMDYTVAEQTRRDLWTEDQKTKDDVRKAIVNGCLEKGITPHEADHVYYLIMKNRDAACFSQIICQAMSIYWNAWLRVHYPMK